MEEGPSQPAPAGAANRRLLWILALAMAAIFPIDLILPRTFPLLPYYFVVVVLSASFATPRQMVPLIVEAYVLAIGSGFFWGFVPVQGSGRHTTNFSPAEPLTAA
ncbi:MAG: hypothetical protein VKJ66_11270 [Synechococcus sp.]|nr:hypothetical protein [Synechococcus sp.]